MDIHVVRRGDTVYRIAEEYNTSPQFLIQQNELADPDHLVIGQTLVLLYPRQTYTVAPGDTLFTIAARAGLTVNALYRNNPQLWAESGLVPGEQLVLSFEEEKRGSLDVSGYAYPFVDKELYRSTMPSLTAVIPFTYGITESGGLVDLDDGELIRVAKEYGVAPMMHLSTLTDEGGFSNDLASLVLNNMQIQDTLIANLELTLRERCYLGLDVDFEFIFASDREAYAAFLARLTARLNPQGYEVIAALAPKTYADQPGLLYEGHDYKLVGAAVNAVLLMTYEWGYTYGPPMAVAPVGSVRGVLDYAVTEIPREKIFMGIPNYGYDWRLPFLPGESRAKSISNVEAVDIARKYGAEIRYSEPSQAPFFNYYDENGRRHEVWFEDARSIRAKLSLVTEFGFRGIGYWNLMRPFPQNWRILNALYGIRQGRASLQPQNL